MRDTNSTRRDESVAEVNPVMSAYSRRARVFVAIFAATALTLFAILLAAPFRPFVDSFSGDLAFVSARLITALGGKCFQHGAILSSPVADRLGRKPALLATAIGGIIGGLMQAFSYGHLPVFYIGR